MKVAPAPLTKVALAPSTTVVLAPVSSVDLINALDPPIHVASLFQEEMVIFNYSNNVTTESLF